jgi:PHP family Zn ribbon phosphoesterase
MHIAVDLHSHSGYAGGVGRLSLTDIDSTMRRKGIHVFWAGDCIHPARALELRAELTETERACLPCRAATRRFLMQTEVILSVQLPGRRTRTVAHHVLLLPGFAGHNRRAGVADALGPEEHHRSAISSSAGSARSWKTACLRWRRWSQRWRLSPLT